MTDLYKKEMTEDEVKFVTENTKEQFCFIDEWFEENLPLENKEGDAMEEFSQVCINHYFKPPGVLGTLPQFEDAEKKTPKLPKAPKMEPEKVLVFGDMEGWCEGIIENAPEGRIKKSQIVEFATEYDLDDFTIEDVEELLKPGWDLIIFGSGLDMPESNSVADVIDWNTKMTKLYWFVLKGIHNMQGKCCKRLAVLTRGCLAHEEFMHKDVGLGLIASSTFFGMSNTARMEFGVDFDIPIQYIDTEYWLHVRGKEDILPKLASECFRLASFGHNTVRILHNPGRYVMRFMNSKKYEMAKKEFKMPTEGIIGISGGNGALGIVFGGWFIEQCKKQKVPSGGLTIQFLSRSMKVADNSAKAWKKVQTEAEKLGIKVEQAKLDMSTQEAVNEYVKACDGKLVGFVHSAGVLEDAMIGSMTWEKFEKSFASKHFPALYLHQALEEIPQKDLQWMWLFGSVAEYGNMGQLNYSGSNGFLAALARHRTALGKKTICMKWGGWGEVGMAATMADALRKRLDNGMQPLFKTKEGLAGLEAGLKTNCPNFSTYKLNDEAMMRDLVSCDKTSECYGRNTYSEICPTVRAPGLERKYLMTLYRTTRGLYQEHAGNDWLVWFTFVGDEIDPADMEDSTKGGYPMAPF